MPPATPQPRASLASGSDDEHESDVDHLALSRAPRDARHQNQEQRGTLAHRNKENLRNVSNSNLASLTTSAGRLPPAAGRRRDSQRASAPQYNAVTGHGSRHRHEQPLSLIRRNPERSDNEAATSEPEEAPHLGKRTYISSPGVRQRKKKKKTTADSYANEPWYSDVFETGRRFFRREHAFPPFAGIINSAVVIFGRANMSGNAEKEPADLCVDDLERSNWASYEILGAIMQDVNGNGTELDDIIISEDTAAIVLVLKDGATQVRQANTNLAKTTVTGWMADYEGSTPLKASSKDGRGFKHVIASLLLWPLDEAHTHPEVFASHDSRLKRETHVDPDLWPLLLWAPVPAERNSATGKLPPPEWDIQSLMQDGLDDHGSPHMYRQFLQNPLILRMWRLLYYGSTAGEENSNAGATRHFPNGVTIGSIIWCAVLLRFALSEDGMLSQKSPPANGFDYVSFYDGLYNILTAPENRSHKRAIVKWWNQQVMPHYEKKRKQKLSSTAARFSQQLGVVPKPKDSSQS
ncbi:hypothetical protein DL93DRAFT_2160977 [Clavulina sp. PMI_390]|nr:hypothetical protein DL93DRAFT_2160977 [Clavulina sp. PMI_390]